VKIRTIDLQSGASNARILLKWILENCCENVNQKMMIHVECSSKTYLKLVSSKFDGGGFQENRFPGVWTR
jgi:hypothetical protein